MGSEMCIRDRAGIIANEMDVNLKITSGPAIEKPGEMASILNNLSDGDLLFVDEIHRLNRQVEEVLTAYRQYGRFYWTGVVWPDRAVKPGEAHAVARAWETARDVLSGEHSDLYGQGYIYQAEFEQGADVIYCEDCGIYFGR